jgi:short-subunit dehydrogenase
VAERVLILGATSALAVALAHGFACQGHDLVLAARHAANVEAIAADLRLRHGVTVEVVLLDALKPAPHAWGELAGVVLAIGTLGDEAGARHDAALARQILETNFVACVSLLTPLADQLEARGKGFIIGISSVAGDRGRQSNYLYGSAKAGLSAYLQGLRNRLYPAGVHVMTVKPGFMDTPMTYGRPGMFLVASPEAVAGTVMRGLRARRDVVYAPRFWWVIMAVIKALPEALFKRMKL